MGALVGFAFAATVVLLAAVTVVAGALIGLAYVLDGRRQARCRYADAARVIIERERYRAVERSGGLHAAPRRPHEQPGRQGKTFPDAALPAGSPPRSASARTDATSSHHAARAGAIGPSRGRCGPPRDSHRVRWPSAEPLSQ
ncbi:MAG: hypothetical protein ACRDQ7_05985 [Haloechinothrix sp.]